LAERAAWWALRESDEERRALRQALGDVQSIVQKWLDGLDNDSASPQPRLLEDGYAPHGKLLSRIRDELLDAIKQGHAPLGSRLRGRRRGLTEGLGIVAGAFGVDGLGLPLAKG